MILYSKDLERVLEVLEEGMRFILIALFPFTGIRLYSFRRRCYAVVWKRV